MGNYPLESKHWTLRSWVWKGVKHVFVCHLITGSHRASWGRLWKMVSRPLSYWGGLLKTQREESTPLVAWFLGSKTWVRCRVRTPISGTSWKLLTPFQLSPCLYWPPLVYQNVKHLRRFSDAHFNISLSKMRENYVRGPSAKMVSLFLNPFERNQQSRNECFHFSLLTLVPGRRYLSNNKTECAFISGISCWECKLFRARCDIG